MSKIIEKETLETLVTGTKSIANVIGEVGTELANEAINLFILQSVLGILKFVSVFVVFFIVKKYIDTMIESAEGKDNSIAKAFKTSALVASIIFFTTKSFPHIEQIGKALVSPSIFLLEKTNEFRKNN